MPKRNQDGTWERSKRLKEGPRKKGNSMDDSKNGTNRVYDNGTIVRKKFDDGTYYEGEVIGYDDETEYYKILYLDGDREEFDTEDMQKHRKQSQKYAREEAREAGHLAAFVASVLKDRSVDDLVEENKRLQKKLDDQLLIQIIGHDGSLYYQTSMKTGYFVSYPRGETAFCVALPPRRDDHGQRMALPDSTPFDVVVGGVTMARAFTGHEVADFIRVNEGACVPLHSIFVSCPEQGRKELLGLFFDPEYMPGVMGLLEETVKADIRSHIKWQINDKGDFVEYTPMDNFERVFDISFGVVGS